MRERMPKRLLAVAVMFALMGAQIATVASAEAPSNGAFQRTWARHDEPVTAGRAERTWMWGPQAYSAELSEPYLESPEAERQVQYFDKSRMEINHPEADSSTVWYVTNGLLATELITGKMQIGDNTFEQREPAEVNVAGDWDDSSGPTDVCSGRHECRLWRGGYQRAPQPRRHGLFRQHIGRAGS
jgi:hypothetical protein